MSPSRHDICHPALGTADTDGGPAPEASMYVMTTTAATTTPVVGFDQVSKTYGTTRAVDGLSLQLHPGETVALLGPNGAGKSTTLDLLLGLKQADRGTVSVFGTSPREAIVAGRVGAMLQSGG